MTKGTCHKCGTKLSFEGVVGRREECPGCSESVHACLNCEFYDEKSYNECRETSADPVKDKLSSNFCDYFQLGHPDGGSDTKDKLISAAEALFKK